MDRILLEIYAGEGSKTPTIAKVGFWVFLAKGLEYEELSWSRATNVTWGSSRVQPRASPYWREALHQTGDHC